MRGLPKTSWWVEEGYVLLGPQPITVYVGPYLGSWWVLGPYLGSWWVLGPYHGLWWVLGPYHGSWWVLGPYHESWWVHISGKGGFFAWVNLDIDLIVIVGPYGGSTWEIQHGNLGSSS